MDGGRIGEAAEKGDFTKGRAGKPSDGCFAFRTRWRPLLAGAWHGMAWKQEWAWKWRGREIEGGRGGEKWNDRMRASFWIRLFCRFHSWFPVSFLALSWMY